MAEENEVKIDLGSFDFTPAWAKKDAGVSVGKIRPEREDRGERKPFGDRKPAGDRGGFGERKPFGDRKPAGDRGGFGERKSFGDRGRRFGRPSFERVEPMDAEIKILPETKALGGIIRKLQGDQRAYKLKELAYFFLDNPSTVLLKVSPKAETKFFQCKACSFASTDLSEVEAHAVAAHLVDYYDSKEIDVEPPKGNFNCVAKCGLSGVLLGPPNIHEFNAVVKEMIRTRYPEMSEAQYRSHIEMVRDAEQIEAWRQSAVKRTVFVPKGAGEDAVPLTREQAEGEFKRTILPSLLDTPKHLMITADKAMETPFKPLKLAAERALEEARRVPYAMCFALRGAFHHRKLNFFRANDSRGPEFVTSVELKEFDAEHAIPELAAIAKFIAENPCSAKNEIVKSEDDEKQLSWLVSTGHVVSFTNGVFSPVEKFPKYGPQWRKKVKGEGEGEQRSEVSEKVKGESEGEGEQRIVDSVAEPAPEAVEVEKKDA